VFEYLGQDEAARLYFFAPSGKDVTEVGRMAGTIKGTLDYPPFWLLAALGVVWGEAWAWPKPVPQGMALAGQGLFWLGLGLLALASLSFWRARTTIVPHNTPSALITGGLYRLSRNPIYLGDALILCGVALKYGAVTGLVLLPVFVWVITRRFIAPEEARLRAAFGAQAERYFQRTRRWL
jgi:protein-S-isoprenylcysteine O-methyltransferase Ste14